MLKKLIKYVTVFSCLKLDKNNILNLQKKLSTMVLWSTKIIPGTCYINVRKATPGSILIVWQVVKCIKLLNQRSQLPQNSELHVYLIIKNS